MTGIPAWSWWLCAVAFALAAVLAWAAIFYARRRGMLDEPGFRRSHQVATPRGGGVGIVVAVSIFLPVALIQVPPGYGISVAMATGGAGLWIALTGWVDDHRHLGVLPRLLMQLLASSLFVGVLVYFQPVSWWWVAPCVLACVWSLNLHNFMDGIDALLGLQILFVGAGIGLLAWSLSQPAVAVAAFIVTAAAGGFLLFNWPPARIFMGDVGSSFAGFIVAALALLLWVRIPSTFWPVLILCSGFVLDSGLTLAWRMWSGKRWYNAHREHLYQWLVRRGWSHVRTGCAYMLWNLLLAAPLAAWGTSNPAVAPWLCVALYGVGTVIWWRGRQACLVSVRRKGAKHVA